MGLLDNVDYRNITFTRSDNVNVNLKVSLNDATNTDSEVLVLSIDDIDNPTETDLFYWIAKQRYTLNEFIYFADNNSLCMRITDKSGTELINYGNCSVPARVFNQVFGINFN